MKIKPIISLKKLRKKGIIKGCALVVILSFPALEIFFRYYHYKSLFIPPSQHICDSKGGFKNNPLSSQTPDGFRNGPLWRTKNSEEKRIFCLGESVTFGYFISNNMDTWPGMLENQLNSRSSRGKYRVVNAAVGGYGTRHIIAQIRHRLKEYNPDIVIVYAGLLGSGLINDKYLWAPFPVSAGYDTFFARMDKFLYRNCSIYRVLLRWRLEPALVRLVGSSQTRADPMRKMEYKSAVNDFSTIVSEIRHIGAVAVVIQYPIARQKASAAEDCPYDIDSIEAISDGIGTASLAEGANVIDMRHIFSADTMNISRYFNDYCHLRKPGNALFAQALAESLFIRKLVE